MARKEEPGLDQPLGEDLSLYERLLFRFKKPRMSRSQALQARPIRNPALKWEEMDSGEIRVVLPRRRDSVGRLLQVLFYIPESRPISLDLVGAKVWKMADGEHTVNDIADALVQEHKLHRREAEVSLTEFLKMLGKRNMVAFAVPSEFLKDEGKDAKPPKPRGDGAEPEQTRGKKSRRRKGR